MTTEASTARLRSDLAAEREAFLAARRLPEITAREAFRKSRTLSNIARRIAVLESALVEIEAHAAADFRQPQRSPRDQGK
jgi:hypothetical protein